MPHPRAETFPTHPYLRAAGAALRRHTNIRRPHDDAPPAAADRPHLDLIHEHLIACHQLLDDLSDATGPSSPAAGHHLTRSRTRLWQAAAAVHDAFHALPLAAPDANPPCHPPARLVDGPPFVTICQRHLAAVHTARRTTTAADLNAPLHGHTTTCVR
ncbi:DUF6238 family protein [Actinacidiphila sp. DG2A-62]|uniref:DUF6238 family protein n=1 Tax=Actinacidiphila sp. DG2A-62 TaxID=3108821 RepID=UPI002DB7DBB5|nr:DUF6238 family protein [Actinacidiphila sp. DG2A-62]MEC3997163.1 DUF6238 family protein [Actinacidiphila sp. DG2A-62]